jgi:hypothetical protein
MVDLALLQSGSYIAGALGVCVAAVYYVMNLRETVKNRRAVTSNNVQQLFLTEEWQQRFLEVMSIQWRDFEDFKKKYDSSVNPGSYVKRNSLLVQYDNVGRQYRSGVIDLDAFGSVSAYALVLAWLKFKPVIEGYRGSEYPRDGFSDFEYIADALERRLKERDPEFMEKIDSISWTKSLDK